MCSAIHPELQRRALVMLSQFEHAWLSRPFPRPNTPTAPQPPKPGGATAPKPGTRNSPAK